MNKVSRASQNLSKFWDENVSCNVLSADNILYIICEFQLVILQLQ